ncbi:MAG: hypothetical protein FRX49_00960 [Trebouxia sp. A1-2]|nr:MAG: hypothetical protein FRX49_03300 [Trebouxia sp. A1-2]KAA6428850.1 MAG: hypothetical protein FRX49_00960 [Trebouxia sp. A1-2]
MDMLVSSAHKPDRCNNLTDYIAFIYDYLISELQLEPCGNINSLYLAAKNTNISGVPPSNGQGEWRGYRIARVPFHHSSHEFPLCLPSPADSPEPGPPYIPPQFLRQYHRNSPIIPLEDR